METWITKLFEVSPIVGAFVVLWFYQRKDYTELVNKTQDENSKREEKYQGTIDKLTDRLKVIDDVKSDVDGVKNDVKDIKNYILKK